MYITLPFGRYPSQQHLYFGGSSTRATKWTPEDIGRWEAFRQKTPKQIAPYALRRLPTIQARALTLYSMALRDESGTRDYIPPYIMQALVQLDAQPKPVRDIPATQPRKLLAKATELMAPWQGKGPSSKTIAALRELGHAAKDIAKALGFKVGEVSRARQRIGLSRCASRKLHLANKQKAGRLEPLPSELLPALLEKRGITTAVTPANVEAFFKLAPVVQHAFAIDTRLREEKRQATPKGKPAKLPSSQALANTLAIDFDIRVARETAKRYLDEARNALQIEKAVTDRYNKSDARALANSEQFKKLGRQHRFKTLPPNWNPNKTPTPEETNAANELFQSEFKTTPPYRVIYHLYCEAPSAGNKELSKRLKETHNIILSPSTVSSYITAVKRTLGIQERVQGVKRLQTAQLAQTEAFQSKLRPTLPKLGGFYAYANPVASAKKWNGDDTTGEALTDVERAVFQCFAAIACKQDGPVTRQQLEEACQRDFGFSTSGKPLYSLSRFARIKIGVADTPLQKQQAAINDFNAQHQKLARKLPPDWRHNLLNEGLTPTSEEEAGAAFIKLPPLKRILYTLHCQFIGQLPAKATRYQKDIKAFITWLRSAGKDKIGDFLYQYDPGQVSHRNVVRDNIKEARRAIAQK